MNFVIVNDVSPAAPRATSDVLPAGGPPSREAAPVSSSGQSGAPQTPDRRNSARAEDARNRRWSQRDQILREGRISIDAEGGSVPCRLRDISRFGAMIELSTDDARRLPDTFVLVFNANRIRSEAHCILRWSKGGLVGVSFAGAVRTSVQRDRD